MENLKVKCITWNVQTGFPDEDLHALLGLEQHEKSSSKKNDKALLPDMYIISLQEVRSQPHNMMWDSVFSEPWTEAAVEVLGGHGYVRVAGDRLQGCVTSVFCVRELVPQLRDIHSCVVRTGLGGLWGNKGAVVLRMRVSGVAFCFVNSHLAAHQGGYMARVADYSAILAGAAFPLAPPTTSILFHDYVFWAGDLNFRLQAGGLTAPEVAAMAERKEYDALLKMDELKKAQAQSDAFETLQEGAITFPPTYKYREGSETEYALTRQPAYTDRILHTAQCDAYDGVKLSVTQLSYAALGRYCGSDHKPVTADYSVKVFSHHHDRRVSIRPLGKWRVGQGGRARVLFDLDVERGPWDYVALFGEGFRRVDAYVSYSYLPDQKDTLGEENMGGKDEVGVEKSETSARNPENSTTSTNKSLSSPEKKKIGGSDSSSDEEEDELAAGLDPVEISMCDDLIHAPGIYVLVYVSRGYSGFLGMSRPFEILPRDSEL